MKKYKAVTALMICLTMGLSACGGNDKAATEGNAALQDAQGSFGEIQGTEEYHADIQEQEIPKKGAAIEEQGTEDNVSEERSGRIVVTGGFSLALPEYLTPTVNDEGLILSEENMNYQMLVAVREYSFDEKKLDKESLAANVRAAEYEITKDVEIVTVAGREFAYFTYKNGTSDMMLAYSAADDDSTFANVVLRCEDISDEEILTDIAELYETALPTDLPDTTREDIIEQNNEAFGSSYVSEGTSDVEETSISVGESEVVITVPEEFHIMDFSDEKENSMIRSFVSSDGNVNVRILGESSCTSENAETWVKESIDIPGSAANVSTSEVQQEQVGDVCVYYQVGGYDKDNKSGETHSYLVLQAVAELPQGGYLLLTAETIEDAELSFAMVKDFFQIK